MFDSIRARITAWYAGVLGTVLLAFSLGVYGLLGRLLETRLDESLLGILDAAATSLAHDADEGQSPEDGARSTVTELSHRQQRLAIYTLEGRLLARAAGVPEDLPMPPGDALQEAKLYSVGTEDDEDDDDHRVAFVRIRLREGTGYLIAATHPLEPLNDEMEVLGDVLVVAVPLAILVAALGGWFLARKSLEPVVAMADEARRMGAADVGGTLLVANPRDELGRLAQSFNDLLGRIAAAFAQQRRFMADASHELRTPLATIRTAASVALQQPGAPSPQEREALEVVARQSRRLSHLVDEMFTLARADAGHLPVQRVPLDLAELVQEAAGAAAVLAAARGVTVQAHTPDDEVRFVGDPELLTRLLQNLLDNAVKYSPDGGLAAVSLVADDRWLRVQVSDEGPGIPAEVRDHVFDRFYRADAARSEEGAGLGLAIARWVAQAHAGELVLVGAEPGHTRFELRLPRPDQSRTV
jgi:two-component system OmpR family sensor kinase